MEPFQTLYTREDHEKAIRSFGEKLSHDIKMKLKEGDFFTIAGKYKKRPFWKFWLWGKPKELKTFKVVRKV